MNPNNIQLYHPTCALVVFKGGSSDMPYIEYYDMDENGSPKNPHPLSVREAQNLAKSLDTRGAAAKAFLKPEGVLPASVLHIDPAQNGSVVWYTKPQPFFLHFTENLGLESGTIALPALVWKADRKRLYLYALARKSKPESTTPLYFAPVFNAYRDGAVCMGNVDVRIKSAASLEQFTAVWQQYFFRSYFSHLIGGNNPVEGNLVPIYRQLIESGDPFPVETLVKTRLTLNDLF